MRVAAFEGGQNYASGALLTLFYFLGDEIEPPPRI
jgi:hypothetical protein